MGEIRRPVEDRRSEKLVEGARRSYLQVD